MIYPSCHELDDGELFLRIQSGLPGDRSDAFDELHRRYAPMLFRFLLTGLARSAQDAEDCIQDVFLAIAQGRLRYDLRRGSARSVLFECAKNRALNGRRSVARGEAAATRRRAETKVYVGDYSAEDLLIRAEDTARARAIMGTLSSEEQAILTCVAEEVPRAEAAAQLGVQPGTLNVRIHRLLKRIRGLIP